MLPWITKTENRYEDLKKTKLKHKTIEITIKKSHILKHLAVFITNGKTLKFC